MKMEEFIPYFDKKVVAYFTDGTSRYGILSGTESEENKIFIQLERRKKWLHSN